MRSSSQGFVSLVHLFLSALVGLGGLGAVVSFQHNSQLLDGLHLGSRITASVTAHAASEPTPSPEPTATPTVTTVDTNDSSTIEPTTTPVATETPSPGIGIHAIVRHGDDDEHDDTEANAGVREGQSEDRGSRTIIGLHVGDDE
jgi:hypothetical protein